MLVLPLWLRRSRICCNAGDLGSVPGFGRSSEGGYGKPLHYSCLENPHGQRRLGGYRPWEGKESDMTKWLNTAQNPQTWGSQAKNYQGGNTNTQKICPFHCKGLEWKSRKSRNICSNRQICPWSTERSSSKASRILPRESTGHSKHPLPTTLENTLHMDITRWSTLKSDWLYSLQAKMEKLYTVSKIRPGADCGSDH